MLRWGEIDIETCELPAWQYENLVTRHTKVVAVTAASGSVGTRPDVPTIVEFVRTHDYDLLVVGFMGHSALYNRLIGSTTDRLVDHAPCAVLVVK